jgi:hypothetical protein
MGYYETPTYFHPSLEHRIIAYWALAKQSYQRGMEVDVYDEQLTDKCLPQWGGGAA